MSKWRVREKKWSSSFRLEGIDLNVLTHGSNLKMEFDSLLG